MRGLGELLVGFLLVAVSFVGIWYLLDEVLAVLLGALPLVLLFFGALFVMMGVSSLRIKSAEPEAWSAESGRDEGRE